MPDLVRVRTPVLSQAGGRIRRGFPAAVPVTVVLGAISLLTVTLRNHDDEDDDDGGHR